MIVILTSSPAISLSTVPKMIFASSPATSERYVIASYASTIPTFPEKLTMISVAPSTVVSRSGESIAALIASTALLSPLP